MNIRRIHTCLSLLREQPTNLKNKKHSSQQWLQRQFADPYVQKAKQENYRCRSAFKLLEMNEKYKILSPGMVVVDCGAAPGSWTQVAVKFCNANRKMPDEPVGTVIAIDRQPIYQILGATILGNLDFTTAEAQTKLRELLDGKGVDLVMSDMAPNATGVRELDHDNIMTLSLHAMRFAIQISKTNATFLTKVWDGSDSHKFEEALLKFYKTVKMVKPDATREQSSEKFILAKGFKGLKAPVQV